MRTLLGVGILSAVALAGQSTTLVDLVSQSNSPPQHVAQLQARTETVAAKIPMPEASLPAVGDAPRGEAPETLARFMAHLRRSVEEIKKIPAYTAVLEQQVFLRERLLEAEKMELKFRREPFSVYLRWPADDQQALFVDGQHDNRLLVRPTRGIVSLRGTWKLRPDSQQAMKESRYPVTELGIEKLCQMILAFHNGPENGHAGIVCHERTGSLGGRDTAVYEMEFASPQSCPTYSRAIMQFDVANHLLVSAENFSWSPENTRDQLLERYVYHNFTPCQLSEGDFNHENASYTFNH